MSHALSSACEERSLEGEFIFLAPGMARCGRGGGGPGSGFEIERPLGRMPGDGTNRVDSWQCGHSTVMPAFSKGTSKCPLQRSQAHLKVSLSMLVWVG